jgi:hypothetical protein
MPPFVWARFTSGVFLSRLNLSQFIAALKTEFCTVRHPAFTVATYLEEFPALPYRQAAVYAKFGLHAIRLLTVWANSRIYKKGLVS